MKARTGSTPPPAPRRSGGASAPSGPAASGNPRSQHAFRPAPSDRRLKRRRLADFDYTGHHAYHLTVVTALRSPALVAPFANRVAIDLQSAAAATGFELLAFVIMPDHVHVLALGTADGANPSRFMQRFKQSTAYHYKRQHGASLWQRSFHDHVIRVQEEIFETARYIVGNPVRAGLVDGEEQWPYVGGTMFDGAEAPPLRPRGVLGAEERRITVAHRTTDT